MIPRMTSSALAGVPPSSFVFLLRRLSAAAVFELARQQAGRALRLDPHLLQHLAGDQLDVLVVDVDALGAVDPLHLGHQVELDVGAAADRQQVGRVERALVELLADLDLLAVGDVQAGAGREAVGVLLAAGLGDDHFQRFVGFFDRDLAGRLGHLRQALRFTRLEELDDARQALGDVLAGDTAGVEGTHGQLRAGLADRLGGDDADRVADVDREAGRRSDAVTGAAHAGLGVALERRADRDHDLFVAERLGDLLDVGQGDLLVALEQLATAFGFELFRRQATERGCR